MSDLSPRRLMIVSNRLPVTIRAEQGQIRISPSTGNLATALGGVHASRGGEWCGWPGDLSRASPAERRAIGFQLASLGCVPVQLTSAEVAHYYNGFANGVLWPLLHYQIDKVRLDAEHDWNVYREVNRRFAEQVAERLAPGDLVWVHDYQLALVPAMIRELCPSAKIGYFLDVPFPAPEVFNILPWREDILTGMLGADLCPFTRQTIAATSAKRSIVRWSRTSSTALCCTASA